MKHRCENCQGIELISFLIRKLQMLYKKELIFQIRASRLIKSFYYQDSNPIIITYTVPALLYSLRGYGHDFTEGSMIRNNHIWHDRRNSNWSCLKYNWLWFRCVQCCCTSIHIVAMIKDFGLSLYISSNYSIWIMAAIHFQRCLLQLLPAVCLFFFLIPQPHSCLNSLILE